MLCRVGVLARPHKIFVLRCGKRKLCNAVDFYTFPEISRIKELLECGIFWAFFPNLGKLSTISRAPPPVPWLYCSFWIDLIWIFFFFLIVLEEMQGGTYTNDRSEDSEEETEKSEEEEEDEDEEEEEPKLKYQRLGFSVLDILKEDAATCMHVHDKFLVCSYDAINFSVRSLRRMENESAISPPPHCANVQLLPFSFFSTQTLGTRSGMVFVLDFNGNKIKQFACHSLTVNEISVDDTGEYVASCSDDGNKAFPTSNHII